MDKAELEKRIESIIKRLTEAKEKLTLSHYVGLTELEAITIKRTVRANMDHLPGEDQDRLLDDMDIINAFFKKNPNGIFSL